MAWAAGRRAGGHGPPWTTRMSAGATARVGVVRSKTWTRAVPTRASASGAQSRRPRTWPAKRCRHAARFADPTVSRIGVLHGTKSYVMQTADGQIMDTHSISAGLDYPSVGPEHAWLRDQERAYYTYATDDEALAAFHELSRTEGIIPALESAHAVAEALKRAPTMRPDQILVVNLSGRGDKDLDTVLRQSQT